MAAGYSSLSNPRSRLPALFSLTIPVIFKIRFLPFSA